MADFLNGPKSNRLTPPRLAAQLCAARQRNHYRICSRTDRCPPFLLVPFAGWRIARLSSLIDRFQLNHARTNLLLFAQALRHRVAAVRRGLHRSARRARDLHHQSSSWQWGAWVAALVFLVLLLLSKPMWLPWLIRTLTAWVALALVARGLAYRAAAAETRRNQGAVTAVLDAWRRAYMHWFWLMQHGLTLVPLLLACLLLWDGRLGLLPLPAAAGALGLCAYALASAGRRTPTLLGICLHHGDNLNTAASWHLLLRYETARRHDLAQPGSRFSQLANLLENPDRSRQMPRLPLPTAAEWRRDIRRRLPRLLVVWTLAALFALPLWWLADAAHRLPDGSAGFAHSRPARTQDETSKTDGTGDAAAHQATPPASENGSQDTKNNANQQATPSEGEKTAGDNAQAGADPNGANTGNPNRQGSSSEQGRRQGNPSDDGNAENGSSSQNDRSQATPRQTNQGDKPSSSNPQATQNEPNQDGASDPSGQPDKGSGEAQNAPDAPAQKPQPEAESGREASEDGQTPTKGNDQRGGDQTKPANQPGDAPSPAGETGESDGQSTDEASSSPDAAESDTAESDTADANGAGNGQNKDQADEAGETQEGGGQNGGQSNQTNQGKPGGAGDATKEGRSASQGSADQGNGGPGSQPSESTTAGKQNSAVQRGAGGPVPDFPKTNDQTIEIEIPTLMGDGEGQNPNREQRNQDEPPRPRKASIYRDGRAPEQTPSATQPLPAWVAELLRDHRATNADNPTKQQQ